MIGKEGDEVFSSLEVMMPMIESMDDGKKFPIVDVVVLFRRSKSLRKISTQVKVTVPIPLHEDSPTSEEGGISHDNKRLANIGEVKYRGSLEFGQQSIKGMLLVGSPRPRLILPS